STISSPLGRLRILNSPGRSSRMASRHGLGRGLGALLPPAPPVAAQPEPLRGPDRQTVLELPVASIAPNPNQPRQDFETKALSDLSTSLRQSGVLQPVVVRRLGQGYQLIVGERRWRAAQLAGIEKIPAVIREASDPESLELALVENLLRENLNPLE